MIFYTKGNKKIELVARPGYPWPLGRRGRDACAGQQASPLWLWTLWLDLTQQRPLPLPPPQSRLRLSPMGRWWWSDRKTTSCRCVFLIERLQWRKIDTRWPWLSVECASELGPWERWKPKGRSTRWRPWWQVWSIKHKRNLSLKKSLRLHLFYQRTVENKFEYPHLKVVY